MEKNALVPLLKGWQHYHSEKKQNAQFATITGELELNSVHNYQKQEKACCSQCLSTATQNFENKIWGLFKAMVENYIVQRFYFRILG